ncbi:uncharacterized protein LOC118427680 [Branchiostoma floridae]|uniref:Uncharacterized protein LOC118427680 n=1 Tax=Branchiostoma floridae TaxID=7739 RepID=A0A9J7N4Z7_BRAFL|nr:uncharacterized protein LOC118427680 [Branchiostoma floridae]
MSDSPEVVMMSDTGKWWFLKESKKDALLHNGADLGTIQNIGVPSCVGYLKISCSVKSPKDWDTRRQEHRNSTSKYFLAQRRCATYTTLKNRDGAETGICKELDRLLEEELESVEIAV